jgi:hypothetical protein
VKRILTIVLLLSATCCAADAPKITPELRAKYWRAHAEALAASVQAQQTQAKLQAVQAEMLKVCGDQQLIAGPDGEPTCQAKTEAPKK